MTNGPGRKLILIVDDSPENISVVCALLKDHYRLKAVTSGEKALALAVATDLPDLILLDVVMPEMDGYEVCRRLKAAPATREIPVIFLTMRDQTEEEAFGLALGAVDYIVKPIKPPILFARVQTHLALAEAMKTLAIQNQALIETARLREDVEHITRHDLKGPLNIIIGAPQLLLISDGLTDRQRNFIEMIEKAGYQMLEMINRSLDLYKMENGIYLLQPEPVNLPDVIRVVLGELQPMVKIKSLAIHLDVDGKCPDESSNVLANGERLLCHSIFSNLCKNAIEASAEGETINISVRSGCQIVTSVDNSGEVPEKIRDRFFDKFTTSGKKDGTGLGTYSAHLIARTLGGSITLDTSIKGRTSVHVALNPFEGVPSCALMRPC